VTDGNSEVVATTGALDVVVRDTVTGLDCVADMLKLAESVSVMFTELDRVNGEDVLNDRVQVWDLVMVMEFDAVPEPVPDFVTLIV